MKLVQTLIVAAFLVEAACSGRGADNSAANDAAPTAPSDPTGTAAPAPPSAPKPPAPNETLAEPNGPVDPTSTEAAGQVVQSYGALIEQQRWKEANALWGDAAAAAKAQTTLQTYPVVHLEIGNLGEPEGAAGSIYVTMPVLFYGDDKAGQPFRHSTEVVLRRVNDVPGSTEAQRRWHIERIDWGS
jgi:hypothetical protein